MAFDSIATLEGHENEVKCVAWNRSGTLLASCSRDKNIWLWEASTDSEGMPGSDEDAFECLAVLSGHTQDVKHVAFHPTEDLLVSCSYDDVVKVWKEADVGAGSTDWYCSATLPGHTSTVWASSFEASGERFVTCGDDAQLIIWARAPTAAPAASVTAVASSLVSKLWSAAAASPDRAWKRSCALTGFHTRTIYSVDWAAGHGRIVTGAADDAVRVFVERSADPAVDGPGATAFELEISVRKAHAGDVNCVKWSPRFPTVLLSTGDDNCVKIWKLVL